MSKRAFTISVLVLTALIVYLFVQAPPPLEEGGGAGVVSVETLFRLVSTENERVRELWTTEIVEAGTARGLRFEEEWRDADVQAGPLPALFLRETAASLEADRIRLGLFLGSDQPISSSNLFAGEQAERFEEVRSTREPQVFFAEDTELHVAMWPDVAMAEPCVVCHNEHPESPKRDWALGDVMGAVTWTYPRDSVTLEELVDVLRALRQAFRDAYTGYLEKVATFDDPPIVGDRWPRQGYHLPSVDVFMAEVSRRSSSPTLEGLISAGEDARLR